jgi:hypothetical protein
MRLPDADKIRLAAFCEVVDWQTLSSLQTAQSLRGQHIWRDEVIAERFDWGKQKNIFALAVRVFRIAKPIELPMLAAYAGCKSWVELERDIPTEGATPVLDEVPFQKKLMQFKAAKEP